MESATPAEDLPLRPHEPAVFGGSRRRLHIVWTLVSIVAVTLVAWVGVLIVGLQPAPTTGYSLFPRHDNHHRVHP